MQSPGLSSWFRWQTSWSFALAGLLIVVGPVIWFGPWVPLLDAIAFIGLDSYPPHLSYGPHQYYVFEFTYILPFILSRLCVDCGIGVAMQVTLFYLLQALIFFGVTWQLLERTVRDPWIRSIAIVLGALAFWDGLFLWGGPLAYSLSAALLALAALLTIAEAGDPKRDGTGRLILLTFLAVASHPFALAFALPLFAVRVILLPASRWKSIGIIAVILLYAVVVRRDSPEGPGGSLLPQLFGLRPREILFHIPMLFTWNSKVVLSLIGITSPALSGYFAVLAAIHLLGFLASPFAAVLAKDSPALRMLAALNTLVAVMFFLSLRDNNVISFWPQRILTFYSWVTYAAGIACPGYLITRFVRKNENRDAPVGPRTRCLAWTLPVLLIPVLLAVELPVLRVGRNIPKEWRLVRQAVLDTGLKDVILYPEFGVLSPSYRRCLPFLLFSDRYLIARDIQVFTEWSAQPRHPSRTIEAGKPHYRLRLSNGKNGSLDAQVLPFH